MDHSAIKEEVWRTIQAMNRLWTVENKIDGLAHYFHERMVALSPTDRLRIDGCQACVAAWKAFTENARIHSWKEIDPRIELFGEGHFAVVTYYFDMSFDMNGQTINMGGRDMFALVNEQGKWWVVSDQFSSYPSS
jgi:hypothetical protein